MLKLYVKYASVSARGLALPCFDLGLLNSLHSCRSFSNSLSLSMASGIFAGSSACPSSTSFEEAVELLIMKDNLDALFQFCHHVESMINTSSQAPCDESCFHLIVIFQNHSFTEKRHTDAWKQFICFSRLQICANGTKTHPRMNTASRWAYNWGGGGEGKKLKWDL